MKYLIVGSGPQALFIIRLCASKAQKITLLYLEPKVANASCLINEKVHVTQTVDLVPEIKKYTSDHQVIFAGGKELQVVYEFCPELFDRGNVTPRNSEALSVFTSKQKTCELATNLDIKTLTSIPLPTYLKSPFELKKQYILKWEVENTARHHSDFKTMIFSSRDAVLKYVDRFNSDAIDRLILQEYLGFSNVKNISYLGYFNDGSCSLGMLAEQLVQYPQGITAHLKECRAPQNEHIIESSMRLIKKMGLSGFCEVEYLQDTATGNTFLIEVNPRPCGWSSALLGKYPGLTDADLKGEHELSINNDVEWINILRFLRASLSGGFEIFIRSIFKAIKVKNYDVFSITDLKPFFSQISNKFK